MTTSSSSAAQQQQQHPAGGSVAASSSGMNHHHSALVTTTTAAGGGNGDKKINSTTAVASSVSVLSTPPPPTTTPPPKRSTVTFRLPPTPAEETPQQEPTVTAVGSVSPAALKNKNKKRAPLLTTANSDEHCLKHPDNMIARLWYQMSLMTGLYCLDKTERRISVTGALILFLLFLIQFVVFTKGVVDGILQTRGRLQEEGEGAAAAASMDVDASITTTPNEIPMETAGTANNVEL